MKNSTTTKPTTTTSTTTVKPWIISAADLESTAIKISRAVVKRTAESYGLVKGKKATEAYYGFNRAVERVFRKTAIKAGSGWVNLEIKPIAEQIDELKTENEIAFKTRAMFPAESTAYTKLTAEIKARADEIMGLYARLADDTATIADDVLQTAYMLLLEDVGKDIANETITFSKNQRSYTKPICGYIYYQIRKLITDDILVVDTLTCDDDGNEYDLIGEILATSDTYSFDDDGLTIDEILSVCNNDRDRTIIKMLDSGYSRIQIADKLNMNYNTLLTYLNRFKARLEKQHPDFIVRWKSRKTAPAYDANNNRLPSSLSTYSAESRR